jgi:hypothetical protein
LPRIRRCARLERRRVDQHHLVVLLDRDNPLAIGRHVDRLWRIAELYTRMARFVVSTTSSAFAV